MRKMSNRLIKITFIALAACTILSGVNAPNMEASTRDQKVKKVKITNANKYLLINKKQKKKLKVKLSPTSLKNKKVIWKSSNKKVVSVTKKGIIRGRRYGKAYITVRSKANKKKYAKIQVQVGRKVTNVSIPAKSMDVDLGASASIVTAISPANATNKALRFKSSNTKVATVSQAGVVTGKTKGTAVITATSTDGTQKKATCKVQVKIPSQTVKVDVATKGNRLLAGNTMTINASVLPTKASNRNIKYTSSNTEVLKVSQLGVVTGINSGTASVRIDATDGRSSTTVEVEVYKMELKNEKLIAHRGYSSIAPENTIPAFQLAVDNGFYGVECDVRKLLDDNFVIMHDPDLNRMCGYNILVANSNLDALKKFEITTGSNIADYPGLTVPTLDEYLDVMQKSDTVHPFIELKQEFTLSELKSIVKIVKSHGLLDRTYFISMYKDNLLNIKTIDGVNTKQLQYVYGAESANKLQSVDDSVVSWCIQNEIDLDSRHTLITASDVSRLHDSGRKVNVWTVNALDIAYSLFQNSCVDMLTTEYKLNS